MTDIIKQGRKDGVWKFKNSIWLILTLVPLAQWSAFFYIANRTDSRKFRTIGNIVLAADMTALMAAIISLMVDYRTEMTLTSLFMTLFILTGLFSVIAGIVCLRLYWKALESRPVSSGGMESITGQTNFWEIKQTAWFFLGFVPLLFFTAFIFPAIKMKNKIYWGYTAVFGAVVILFLTNPLSEDGEIVLWVLFMSHFFSLALLMNIRAKYLKFIANKEKHSSMAAVLNSQTAASEKIKSEDNKPSSDTKQTSSSAKATSAPSESSSHLININTCTEEELIALPGLNIIDAKKTISLREQNGDFGSIEEFITALHIKPHIAAPLYDYITAQPSFKAAPQSAGRTRKIDL